MQKVKNRIAKVPNTKRNRDLETQVVHRLSKVTDCFHLPEDGNSTLNVDLSHLGSKDKIKILRNQESIQSRERAFGTLGSKEEVMDIPGEDSNDELKLMKSSSIFEEDKPKNKKSQKKPMFKVSDVRLQRKIKIPITSTPNGI